MKGKGNLSFQSVKKSQRANRCILLLWKSCEKTLGLWFVHIFKIVYLQWWKGMQSSELGMWKGYLFCPKWCINPPPPTPSLVIHSLNLSASGAGILMISCHQTNCCVACQSRETLYQVNSQVKSMIIKISSLDENSTHFILYSLQWRWGAQFGFPFQCTINPLLSPQGGLIFFQALLSGGLNREGGLKREGGLI